MKIDVQPGSIKDQALQLIARHPLTRAMIGEAMSCNGALLNIALEGMERDGWIRKNEHGIYELLVEIDFVKDKPEKAGEQGGSAPGLNGAARSEQRAPRPAVCAHGVTANFCKLCTPAPSDTSTTPSSEKVMSTESQLKHCPACDTDKRRHRDFDPGAHRCKQCVKENKPKMKPHERVARAGTKQHTPPAGEASAPDVFVIPSTGEIQCATHAGLFVARQQNNIVRFNREQLTAFRDWASRELEQSGEAT